MAFEAPFSYIYIIFSFFCWFLCCINKVEVIWWIFQFYWWTKTPGAPLCIISGTKCGHPSRTTDIQYTRLVASSHDGIWTILILNLNKCFSCILFYVWTYIIISNMSSVQMTNRQLFITSWKEIGRTPITPINLVIRKEYSCSTSS
jgi:hypothetical protein